MKFNQKISIMIKSKSLKMFKFNGNIDVNNWIMFTSHFLTGNPLIIEYFEGNYPEYIRDAIPKLQNRKNQSLKVHPCTFKNLEFRRKWALNITNRSLSVAAGKYVSRNNFV